MNKSKSGYCRFGCGRMIFFSEEFKTQNGALIAMDYDAEEPHQCGQNPYNQIEGKVPAYRQAIINKQIEKGDQLKALKRTSDGQLTL